MAKHINTTLVPISRFTEYRDKGRQFLRVMRMCQQDQEWDAAMVNGVHAAISMNDALCVFRLGKRSNGPSHQDAVRLLQQTSSTDKIQKNAQRLSDILNWKQVAEYTPRRISRSEAGKFAQQVERFFEWAESQLPQL